ncbi:MAG: hypothetical protein ACYC4Q_06510 [Victivallaceae bacterium]
MKKLLIMAASFMVMLGTAQAYAADSPSCGAAVKDQKSDSSKDAKSSDASAKKGKVQTLCPVMAGEIDKNLYVDVKGKRIYVCCKGCIGAVKADPDKYIKILEDQGVEIEKAPESGSK